MPCLIFFRMLSGIQNVTFAFFFFCRVDRFQVVANYLMYIFGVLDTLRGSRNVIAQDNFISLSRALNLR